MNTQSNRTPHRIRLLMSDRPARNRKSRILKAVERLSPAVVVGAGILLPYIVDPDDFPAEGMYWYVFGGLLIAGIYLATVQVIFVHAQRTAEHQKDPRARKLLTLRLKRTRGVAVGGGVALLAAITSLVPGDRMDAFLMWLLLTGVLHLLSWILMNTTLFPEMIEPITDAEIFDTVLLVQTGSGSHAFESSQPH